MSRNKYYYNTHSLQFEQVRIPLRVKLLRAFSVACAILVSATVLYVLVDTFLPSQKEKALMRELDQMHYQFETLTEQIDHMSERLNTVQNRDAELHRFVFGMDPISENIWSAGIGGSDRYAYLSQYPNGGAILKEAQSRADQLERQLAIQSESLDALEQEAKLRARRLESVPSIKPVRVDLLKRNVTLLSGYGIRLHPVHKVKKLHAGIDFTAPRGTAIQATGDGVVVSVRKSRSGYGRHVIIDHGFGYETLYAHMQDIRIHVGQHVKKGQQIGTVGDTGTSTAPHCHYEVRLNGRAIDPLQYCLDGLSPEEYKTVVQRASQANQSFD